MPASFMQTRQHGGSDYDNMECSCEVMRCDCLKPCDCGEAYLDFEVIRIDGGCWCNKLECECQKRCDCVPTDTLPPKPPPPSPPSPPPPLSPSPPPPPPRPPFDPCACANDRAGTASGCGDGGGNGWPAVEPNAVTGRPGCSAHVGDGIDYCYVVEPSTCDHGETFTSVSLAVQRRQVAAVRRLCKLPLGSDADRGVHEGQGRGGETGSAPRSCQVEVMCVRTAEIRLQRASARAGSGRWDVCVRPAARERPS